MNFDNLMNQLRVEYVSSLPEKIQIIRHFYNSGDYLGVREVFHKLKGTGATYGVPEVSLVGETLEAFCKLNPSKLNEAVPDALDILNQIYSCRLNNKEFDVSSDTRFARIKNLGSA